VYHRAIQDYSFAQIIRSGRPRICAGSCLENAARAILHLSCHEGNVPSFRPPSRNPCAWEQARSEGWKSPSGRCPFPVAEGNCVTVRWGGEQPTANMQSVGGRTRFGRARRRASGFKAKSRPGRPARHMVATGSWETITLGGQLKSGDGAREV
jgi:hypothetical protein